MAARTVTGDDENWVTEDDPWVYDRDGKLVYSVRRSTRARRVSLCITPADGLIVTIPARLAIKHVPNIINEREEWIERAARRLTHERAAHLARASEPLLPAMIDLRSLGERRHVIYLPQDRPRTTVRAEGPYRLVVSGNCTDTVAQRALRSWLVSRARAELVPWIHDLAQARSLAVTGTSIRNQRTRWASCSAEGKISLNYNLLFLPRRLVRLVLVHELCHLIEMNHSPRFWCLLEREEPDAGALGEELDRSWTLVPRWSHE